MDKVTLNLIQRIDFISALNEFTNRSLDNAWVFKLILTLFFISIIIWLAPYLEAENKEELKEANAAGQEQEQQPQPQNGQQQNEQPTAEEAQVEQSETQQNHNQPSQEEPAGQIEDNDPLSNEHLQNYDNDDHKSSSECTGPSIQTKTQNHGYHNHYDPYANNGTQNNCDDDHSHSHQHPHQTQQQSFVKNQKQQTAETQTFIEQVDNTVLCISLAGKGYHNGQDEETVDLLCDSAVISLNMFAVSCEHLHQEKNTDALDLGRKQAHDKFAELESKNKAVYELIEPHRNFINAALDGQQDLRYKEDRVEPAAKELFEQDPAEINKAYAQMIHHQQKFDKSREPLLEQETNEKLAKQHKSDLNEYRNSKKYGKNNKKSENKSKPGSKYDRAKITDLYFTKNGKSAEFVDAEAVERAKKEQQAVEQDLFGSGDVYDDILPKIRFMNAALKWTKRNKWKGISTSMPCQILAPNKKERANQDKNMIIVRPCYPWNNCTLRVGVGLLELDEDEIKRIEKKQISKLEMMEENVFNHNLGYKTIEEQEREIDIDHYPNGGSDDNQEMNGNI